MDFEKTNCNGTNSHLFEDLDAGKAVVLFYYMPNCGSCPPPAKKVEAMLEKINADYPGMVKAYAFPYNNTTKCPSIDTWVTTNNLSLFTPVDSGATQVAYYGGFGMPTTVLVGGTDHRVIYTSQSFSNNDTTIMRDSILNMFQTTGVAELPNSLNAVSIYPNPVNDIAVVSIDAKKQSSVAIEVVDITGKIVLKKEEKTLNPGKNSVTVSTGSIPAGSYLIRFEVEGKLVTRKITVAH